MSILTVLAVVAAVIWILGIAVVWCVVRLVPGTGRAAGSYSIALTLTMAVFWPIWLALGVASAIWETHRLKSKIKKPIDDKF